MHLFFTAIVCVLLYATLGYNYPKIGLFILGTLLILITTLVALIAKMPKDEDELL